MSILNRKHLIKMILLQQRAPAAVSNFLNPVQNSILTSCFCLYDLFEKATALITGLWKRC